MAIQSIIKRNGQKVPFEKIRIFKAIEKAFLSVNLIDPLAVASVTEEAVNWVNTKFATLPEPPTVEFVQDIVEEVLMRNGHLRIAKNYILYRADHKVAREEKVLTQIKEKQLQVQISDFEMAVFDPSIIRDRLLRLTSDLKRVNVEEMVESVLRQIYEGIPKHEIDILVLSAARDRIELHYEYADLASRVALNDLYKQILKTPMNTPTVKETYQGRFAAYIEKGIQAEMINPELKKFDLAQIAAVLDPSRDQKFYYLGTQILVDRYLLRDRSADRAVYELPQWFWMRVAMGLAIKENDREKWAIAFYNVLSNMDLVSSTPTLFNSGTCFSQMSSCYLNTVPDSLNDIFKIFGDNANLSKWAGGIGTDWTPVRATGSKIKGTNGVSQGVIPFIKIFNDVALAVNQGGKRKGAMCAYMEIWHLDYEQFMELKKNTGDERRRAHDINTASWIPDLFMKRVHEDGYWTFFCPTDVPELHSLYGKAFEEKYKQYELMGVPRSRRIKAVDLWRKMLTMLFETGHPWVTFKDPINIRNPQDHVGVIHSSNLCTEITLNTSKEETAVCNLASVNLANMIENGKLNEGKLARTIEIGIRMLDNVIDGNFYPIPEAATANFRHRAVGLGLMGYQDALYKLGIPFDSQENVVFADRSMEVISYFAIQASVKLAEERGTYETFKGSKWDRGILPLDSLKMLEQERGMALDVDQSATLDWASLKAKLLQFGMRNSNTMAIAPTATIANIAGVYPCTEPAFRNIYMKENLSGNFLVVNRYLVDDLERIGLWTADTLNQIKLHNGSVQNIPNIPAAIREKYKEVFEIDPEWVIKTAARRSKWIDQSASTNIFMSTTSGRAISDAYTLAWRAGLKTTYYMRSLGATQVTKSTVSQATGAAKPDTTADLEAMAVTMCAVDDLTCEACQ